jgi:asparagine synthase (glutamine-hydrolysing)
MCGISVVVTKSNNVNNLRDRLVRMTNAVKHRGPDDEGYLIINHNNEAFCFGGNDTKVYGSDSNIQYLPKANINEKYLENNTRIALGFRRLSILDLSPTGHQPMSYMNGRYWIVFNGEIYNYVEIKKELLKNGYVFKSNTDTEVILAAYDHFGIDCLNKFNGMWALCIYDSVKHEIFVSRDRFGIKPLYYYEDENLLLFCSEIKQLIAFRDLKINPNITKILNDFRGDTIEYTIESAFTNVYRFPKAHYLKLKIDQFNSVEKRFNLFYELPRANENGNNRFSDEEAQKYSEEYYNLLEDAVKLRLRSDVEVGTCFSGGLDSSSVVHMVNTLLQKENSVSKQKTFSLVFSTKDTAYCDESMFIDKMTESYSLNSFKIEPTLEDVIQEYESMIYAMDTPQHSTLMSYMFTYKLVKSHSVTVTLDGQGADELQAGYLYYLINYFSNTQLKNVPSAYLDFIKNQGSTKFIHLGLAFKLIDVLHLKSTINQVLRKKGITTDPWLSLNNKLQEDFDYNLQTLFHYGDRGAMWNSVENRFPMMDYRLVEFWMKMPEYFKVNNGYTKYTARLAMNKKLPDSVVWRRDKKGWEMPQKEWIKNGLNKIMEKKIKESKFLKDIGLNFSFDNFDQKNNDHRYWKTPIKLYNLTLWHNIFFENNNYK